jgi:hypothetical protein
VPGRQPVPPGQAGPALRVVDRPHAGHPATAA